MITDEEIEHRLKTLDAFIEYADATKKYHDSGSYLMLKSFLEKLISHYRGTKDMQGILNDIKRVQVLAIKHCDRDHKDFGELLELSKRLDALPPLNKDKDHE